MRLFTSFLLAISGCRHHDRDEASFERTPKGYAVQVTDLGSIRDGLFTKAQVFTWLDTRVEEWVALRKAVYTEARCRDVASSTSFFIWDSYRVKMPSGEGFASGFQIGSYIYAAVYTRIEALTEPNVPSYLKNQGPGGTWAYGVLVPGKEIPSISHELDHRIGIGH